MNVVISDLNGDFFNDQENTIIISDNGKCKNCIGCFGCWIKSPGKCIIKDSYENMGSILSECDRLIIVCKCYYGGYSPFVKSIIDRSIGYLKPDFIIKNGEMHHKKRYNRSFDMEIWLYGDISDSEKITAEQLANANAVNLHANLKRLEFRESINEGDVI